MMIMKLSPIRSDASLALSKSDDTLTVNGEAFDFSQLPEGATLPAEAVGSKWIVGDISRINGVIHLTLMMPHGSNPPQHVAFPEPITVTVDGLVELPQ
jgi:hypothetical protein